MPGETGMDAVLDWGGVVRLRLPADWPRRTEEHEGHTVAVVNAPGGLVTLRLVTDAWIPKPGPGEAAVLLREVALRFVRPDDPRAGDRVLEDRRGGGVVASAILHANDGGKADVHYLWLIGTEVAGRVVAAMVSVVCPAEHDGDAAAAAVLDTVDAAVRSAELY